jgi:hypothetical protein
MRRGRDLPGPRTEGEGFGGAMCGAIRARQNITGSWAVKYHELGKSAQPSYLGDFYRGVAVRYVFMAQEASEREKREIEVNAGHPDLPPSITVVGTSDDSSEIFDFPAVRSEGDCEDRAH